MMTADDATTALLERILQAVENRASQETVDQLLRASEDDPTPELFDRMIRATSLRDRRTDERHSAVLDTLADIRTSILDGVGELRDEVDALKREVQDVRRNLPECGALELGSAIRTIEWQRKKRKELEIATPGGPEPLPPVPDAERERKGTPTGVHVLRGKLTITGIPVSWIIRWGLPFLGSSGIAWFLHWLYEISGKSGH